jgi:hypothetical protein
VVFDPSVLKHVVPSMESLALCPTGGESVGGLWVCHASTVELGHDSQSVLVALFKSLLCLAEEEPYEVWTDPETLNRHAGQYQKLRQEQVPPTDAPLSLQRFTAWLRGHGEHVLAVHQDRQSGIGGRLMNAAQGHPVPRLRTDLSMVQVENLVFALDDRWNSPTGVFRSQERTWLVGWWTSA